MKGVFVQINDIKSMFFVRFTFFFRLRVQILKIVSEWWYMDLYK